MAGGSRLGRDLNATPTWAVALVCTIIVVISTLLEKVLHIVGGTFEKKKKKALVDALEKIKTELMVLGFISLLLTFGQNYIAQVCITEKIANTMLPCPLIKKHAAPAAEHAAPAAEHATPDKDEGDEHHRRLLWYEHRILSADSPAADCPKGKVPVISVNALHQLHIFIFFLAVFHVIFGATTMLLGRLKIRGWKEWEREAFQDDFSNNPSRFRLTKETSFVKDHAGSFMTRTPILFYIACFWRHIFRSVRKADYLTMRHGFISVHLAPGSKFDFQKYIKRSLEDDFKIVVGISPLLWTSAVIYLLLNVHGSQMMFWLSIMPFVTILAVGTKLQAIITQMAVEIQERHAVVQGIPLVQVSDKHFWFGWPKLILYLIHLTLFQNAFEITYFIWITYEFGLNSCFHDNFHLALARVAIGGGVQFICSYVTLPLYALVTQMGSTMKRSIFDDQTSKALKNWTKNAKKKNVVKPGTSTTVTLGGIPDDDGTPDNSPKPQRQIAGDPAAYQPDTANITASVDIPLEDPSPARRNMQSSERDLLSGP